MRKVSAEGRQKEEQMRGESQRSKHMRKVSMLGMQNKEQMREVIKERTKKVRGKGGRPFLQMNHCAIFKSIRNHRQDDYEVP